MICFRDPHVMPAGVSWPTYLKFFTAAGLSMVAGAQAVHALYKPLDDLELVVKKIEQESEKLALKSENKAVVAENIGKKD